MTESTERERTEHGKPECGITIRPETIYTRQEVMGMFTASNVSIVEAERSGALKFRKIGTRKFYLGRWVLDWVKYDTVKHRQYGMANCADVK